MKKTIRELNNGWNRKKKYCESCLKGEGKYYIFREGLPLLLVCNTCRLHLEKRKRVDRLSTRHSQKVV